MRVKKSCRCCKSHNEEPECITTDINEVDLIEQLDKVIKSLKDRAKALQEIKDCATNWRGAEDLDEALSILCRCKTVADNYDKLSQELKEKEYFVDDDYETPDLDRVAETMESFTDSDEEKEALLNTPGFQKYINNSNLWMKLEDKKKSLLKKLNAVKRQQKEVLKECRKYEDSSIDEFKEEMSKLFKALNKVK